MPKPPDARLSLKRSAGLVVDGLEVCDKMGGVLSPKHQSRIKSMVIYSMMKQEK